MTCQFSPAYRHESPFFLRGSQRQDDGNWQVSLTERGPTLRPLSGRWWQDMWQIKKVLYAKFPDGHREARHVLSHATGHRVPVLCCQVMSDSLPPLCCTSGGLGR